MMNAVDLIRRTRDDDTLSTEEIGYLVSGFTSGAIPDYQVTAWLMAVYFRGLTDRETTDLTLAMAASGKTLDLGSLAGRCVDKHSTGGVGDKTTLVVAPVVAACGVPVAKLSGRGLGFTGGTLDKLESIPGFRTNLTAAEFVAALERVGLVIAGQSAELAPADGRLYALRDVTATVDSLPLIASSIMSKKLAAGAGGIVLDVKYGLGAFMKNLESARLLAETMVIIGTNAGRRTGAVISAMDQPLGLAVGNALEVREAIATLKGEGPSDLRDICRELAAQMLLAADAVPSREAALVQVDAALDSGRALAKLVELVKAQGGDTRYVERPDLLPEAPVVLTLVAPRKGYIGAINAGTVGLTVASLGAGRMKKGDTIDPAVGIVLRRKIGDLVSADEPIADIHARDAATAESARERLRLAVTLFRNRVPQPELISAVIPARQAAAD